MKKFSKVLALGLATTMLGGVFVGCSQEAAPAEPTPAEPAKQEEPKKDDEAKEDASTGEEVELSIVSMYGGTDPNAVTFEALVDEYESENPHVKVDSQTATADDTWKASVATDFAAGNEPDVLHFFTDVSSAPIVEQGKVVSIEEIRKEYPEYAANINPAALDSAKCPDGKQYAVPTTGYYEALFCNADMFEEHGIELPTTWDKLMTAIEQFSAKGITPIAVALGHQPHYWIEHLILTEGGVQDHSNRDIAAVKDTWVAGLTHFKTLADMGAFPVDTASTQNELVQAQFINKEAAMFLDGNWAIGSMAEIDGTVVPLPVPARNTEKNDGTQLISGFSSGFYITKQAWDDPAKREEAVKLITKLTSDEAISAYITQNGGGAPAAPGAKVELEMDLGVKGSAMAGNASGVDGAVDGWLKKSAWDYLRQEVPAIAAGKSDPAEVIEKVIELNSQE